MSYVLESEAEARFPMWVNGQRDYKAWAKRILYRIERNDKDVTKVQADAAERAMNIKQRET